MKLKAIFRTTRCVQHAYIGLIAAISALVLTSFASSWAVPTGRYTVPTSDQTAPVAALAKGRFLVASRSLSDVNFAQTVILLIDYHSRGAMGLIINQPTEVRLAAILPDMAGLQQRPDTVFLGGPVERNRMTLLIRSGRALTDAQQVLAGIHVSSSRTLFERLVDKAEVGERFHVYAGYAGWAPGQLEREVSRGDWHVLPADAETVFDKTPADIWPELTRKGSIRWLRFNYPDGMNRAYHLASGAVTGADASAIRCKRICPDT